MCDFAKMIVALCAVELCHGVVNLITGSDNVALLYS